MKLPAMVALSMMFLVLCAARFADCQVFKWVDQEGITHFTNHIPSLGQKNPAAPLPRFSKKPVSSANARDVAKPKIGEVSPEAAPALDHIKQLQDEIDRLKVQRPADPPSVR